MGKIIFLDIDGVLNCAEEYKRRDKAGETIDAFMVSKKCITCFEQVLNRVPDAKIIISSTWRYKFRNGVDKPDIFKGEMWEYYVGETIASRIIGQTKRTIGDDRRGDDIHKWLSGAKCSNWAIIDDNSDMLDYQMSNLVKTEYDFGFTEKHIDETIRILNRNKER